ncbi:hypothetical protein [Halocatena marina]|uniref:Uncharacterized protein n=1 Tax=Halocatena marina TaxID=2934937 RepID=A0ABD5YU13_9EURY|nr:hypothetical protein [Halocatena marina]
MDDNKDDWMNATRQLVGALIVLAISWHVFWEIIHPALVSLSSIFAYNPKGRIGRYPDSPAIAALFGTVLLGLFVYFLFEILIFKGIDEFIGACIGIYGIIVVLPIVIVKNDVLPLFGIDRWKYDPQEDDT